MLCLATLESRKNQVRLIRAYRQIVPDAPHALVLTGPDGWGADAITAEIDRPGPGAIVRTGSLSPEDLDAVYRGADAVAYVSSYEGFGLPLLEAMQRGVPVLASSTPAMAETAGDAALLVDPADVAAIAEGLARLLTDRALHDDLVEKGRARARRGIPGRRPRALPSTPIATPSRPPAHEDLVDRHRVERRGAHRRVPRVHRRADAQRPTRS